MSLIADYGNEPIICLRREVGGTGLRQQIHLYHLQVNMRDTVDCERVLI